MLLGIELYSTVEESCHFLALSYWKGIKASEYAFKKTVHLKAVFLLRNTESSNFYI